MRKRLIHAGLLFLACTLLIRVIPAIAAEKIEKAGDPAGMQLRQPADKGGGEAAVAGADKGRKPSLEWGTELYNHYCTPCHGVKGDGNGFNAPKLIVKPANHTDAAFMSARNDQKLFDTINLGGVEVAKSTLMPPWGAALDNDDKIRSLILKLRDLCRCQAAKNW